MAFIAKLLIDGKEIDVLSYKFGFKKDTDIQCKSTTLTHLKGFEIEIEATESSYFEEWMTSAKPKQKIALQTFYPHLNGASKTTVFYDCYLIGHCVTFSATNNQPMKEKLKIACAGVKAPYSQRQYAATWRKTFEKEQSYKTPVVGFTNQEKGVDILSYKITDTNENEIQEYFAGEFIQLHFTTKNAVGETINLNLFEEKKFNFKYNGKKLPNNTLKDYKITNDTEIVTLEVVENENITY